ncbi:MAG: hypothetical protein ABSG34_08830 [Candidatus Sulfotelmatobacter sp.]|jgi:hypothetical protein
MGMKFVRKVSLFFFFLLSTQLFSQSSPHSPAATASIFEVSAGYAFIRTTSTSEWFPMNGADANALLHISPRWGAMLDLTYARSPIIPGTNRHENLFSGLVGPVYYLVDGERYQVFLHSMVGMAWVDGAVPLTSTTQYQGYETRLSYAFGGAVERSFSPKWAARITADYQRTQFVNSHLAIENQNDFKATAGIVYRFGNRW